VKFGSTPVSAAGGGIIAHAVRHDGLVLKKGHLVGAPEIAALQQAGIADVVVARLEAGDIGENEAALSLARAVAGSNLRIEAPFTGRSNLFSEVAGVLVVSASEINALNDIDERVTIATLPAYRSVVAGEMVATVKIIPFAVPGETLEQCMACARTASIEVKAYKPLKVGVVSTLLPGLKDSVIAKTLRVLEERLAVAQAGIWREVRVEHDTAALARAIGELADQSDIIIIFGASAITDRRDVIPAAIEAAGGRIDHFGMPVDPGNLLLLGEYESVSRRTKILGAPGCARSPAENGFDWVLQRMLAGVEVSSKDIKRMGVGGLLMEIVSRGQPRAKDAGDA
jgi:molybdenum cofactor cytidylyltransferase